MATQLETLKALLTSRGNKVYDDTTLTYELDSAEAAILNRRCSDELEDKFLTIQVELAIQSISKYGTEGESAHSENKVSRVYEGSGRYSQSTLSKIVPLVGFIKRNIPDEEEDDV